MFIVYNKLKNRRKLVSSSIAVSIASTTTTRAGSRSGSGAGRSRPSALAQNAVFRVAAHRELVSVAVRIEVVAAAAELVAVRVEVVSVAVQFTRHLFQVVQPTTKCVRDRLQVHEVAESALMRINDNKLVGKNAFYDIFLNIFE